MSFMVSMPPLLLGHASHTLLHAGALLLYDIIETE